VHRQNKNCQPMFVSSQAEYELVKAKKHHCFRFLSDFYSYHGTSRQTFAKYYNRYLQSGLEKDLIPRKRGPKWKSRRTLGFIEQKVLEQRRLGINRYEIHAILNETLKSHTPAPSTIYKICRRHGLNRLKEPMKQNKRKIIKERAGELGHLDCHYLSKDLIANDSTRYYLVALVDDASRIAWASVIRSLKSLDTMFASLAIINLINVEYGIQFEAIMTDNGSEVSSRAGLKEKHPFERMLMELGIKHKYTKPYRPQTNGKVERFWRTLNDDLIEGTYFDNLDHFKQELEQYLLYYNTARPHQGINGNTPKKMLEILSANYVTLTWMTLFYLR
jgi:transposase InsO family protein